MNKPLPLATTGGALDHCSGRQLQELLSLTLDEPRGAIGSSSDEAEPFSQLRGDKGVTGAELAAVAVSELVTLDELRRIKALAKRLVQEEPAGPSRDAAKLLYHLSIAAALARFGAEMSRTPDRTRRGIHERLAATFNTHPAGKVFAAAARRKDP